jgi:hypothetical protein
MVKGYPMILPLQTKLAAQSSISHRHIQVGNCGGIASKVAALHEFCSPLLTMNSVAQALFPD